MAELKDKTIYFEEILNSFYETLDKKPDGAKETLRKNQKLEDVVKLYVESTEDTDLNEFIKMCDDNNASVESQIKEIEKRIEEFKEVIELCKDKNIRYAINKFIDVFHLFPQYDNQEKK